MRWGCLLNLDDTAKTNMVLRQLHATNQAEISTGKLAQERAQNPEIKQFGSEMANDHASADQKLLDFGKTDQRGSRPRHHKIRWRGHSCWRPKIASGR